MYVFALAVVLSMAPPAQGEVEQGREPVREEERCEEPQVPSPTALQGAQRDAQGRASLRPRVEWASQAGAEGGGYHLVDAADEAAEAPELLSWVATEAGLIVPGPTLVPGGGETPAVRSDFGVRTELRLGALRMLAEGVARVDAQGTTDEATASMRLSPKGRVQLEAQPHERVHLGLEFCHRDARGLDARASRTSGLASVRFGF